MTSTPDPLADTDYIPDAPPEYDLWDTPEMQKIRQAALARDLPEMAMLVLTLVVLTSEVHPRVYLEDIGKGEGNLNLFAAIVGRSGTGKTVGIRSIHKLLGRKQAKMVNPSSGEGILDSFRAWEKVRVGSPNLKDPTKVDWEYVQQYVWKNRACFMKVDEVGTLAAVHQRRGNVLMTLLNTAWSGDDLMTNAAKQESNRDIPAGEYRLSGVIGVQPGASGLLMGGEAENGTTQRFIFAKATFEPGHKFPDEVPEFPTPFEFHELPETFWVNQAEDNEQGKESLIGFEEFGIEEPEPLRHAIAVSKPIRAEIRQRTRESQLDTAVDHLDGHRAYCQLKVAAAVAILHDRPYIVTADWKRAEAVMNASEVMRSILETEAAREAREGIKHAGQAEALKEDAKDSAKVYSSARVLANLLRKHMTRETCADGCSRKCLSQGIGSTKRKYLNDAIDKMIELSWGVHEGARFKPGPKRP